MYVSVAAGTDTCPAADADAAAAVVATGSLCLPRKPLLPHLRLASGTILERETHTERETERETERQRGRHRQ
jgi:hypothetical protein